MTSSRPRPATSSNLGERLRSPRTRPITTERRSALPVRAMRYGLLERMTHLLRFHREILRVVLVRRGPQRDALAHLDAARLQALDFARVVGHERRATDAEVAQDRSGDVVAPSVVSEAQHAVRLDGVDPILLQRISAHLVSEADSAPFLAEVHDDAPARDGDGSHCLIELIATIAFERAHYLARPA